jgi:DNA-binding response OmpR family regulator
MHALRDGRRAITVGDLTLDTQARMADRAGALVDLTRTEFDILAALAAIPGTAMSRKQIIEAVWGPGWYGDEQVVDVHVAAIRRKLNDSAASPRYLRTVRGVGYALGDPE